MINYSFLYDEHEHQDHKYEAEMNYRNSNSISFNDSIT